MRRPSPKTAPNEVYAVTVRDPYGESDTQSFNLTVTAETVAPQLRVEHESLLRLNADPADDGVVRGHFFVRATDNVKVTYLRLTVQGPGVTTGSDYTIDYKLDLVGNRLEKKTTQENGDVLLVNSAFNLRDWLLTEETRLNGNLQDTATYGYDTNGSLTSRSTTTGDSATYTWNLRNRLASASVTTSGQTKTSAYEYDDSGIQVRRTENGTQRLLIVDANNPTGYAQVTEELRSGLLVASFVYGLEPLSQSQAGTVSHYLLDGHSGVRLLLDAAQALLNTYRYDAFGGMLGQTGTAINPILYRGERFDPVLGQYYLRARFYDAATGQFTKLDPFGGSVRQPLSLHKYTYAHADGVLPQSNLEERSVRVSLTQTEVRHEQAASAFFWSRESRDSQAASAREGPRLGLVR